MRENDTMFKKVNIQEKTAFPFRRGRIQKLNSLKKSSNTEIETDTGRVFVGPSITQSSTFHQRAAVILDFEDKPLIQR